MTEEQKQPLKVVIDRSEEIKSKDAEIEVLNRKLGEHEALIKKYMAEDAQRVRIETERKSVEAKMDKKPPESGETARLEDEHTLRNVDFENSEFLDMMRFPSVEKAIETTEYLAKKGSPDAVRAMRIISRKVLEKPIDFTFKGSILDMVKSEVPIGEFDDQYLRKQKEAHNQRLRANRLKWEVS